MTSQLDAAELRSRKNNISALDYTVNLPSSIHLELLGIATGDENTVKAELVKSLFLPIQIDFEDAEARSRFYEKNYKISPVKVEIRATDQVLNRLRSISTLPLTTEDLNKKKFAL